MHRQYTTRHQYPKNDESFLPSFGVDPASLARWAYDEHFGGKYVVTARYCLPLWWFHCETGEVTGMLVRWIWADTYLIAWERPHMSAFSVPQSVEVCMGTPNENLAKDVQD